MKSEWRSCEPPLQRGTDGIESSATAPNTAKSCQRSERASTSPSPPAIIAAPSTSRMFETTEPVIDPRTTFGQAVGDGEQRDDQLGRVAEARVQEAADPRARVFGRVLGRLADQPGERDQRGGGEQESVVASRWKTNGARIATGVSTRRSPQDPARHAATLAAA